MGDYILEKSPPPSPQANMTNHESFTIWCSAGQHPCSVQGVKAVKGVLGEEEDTCLTYTAALH